MEKMTNKKALEFAIANLDNQEVISKLEAMLVQLEKKAQGAKKENEQGAQMKNAMLAYLMANTGKGFTVSEIQNAVPEVNPTICPNQRAAALIRTMLRTEENPDNPIVKFVEKRKSYFMVGGA